MATSWIRVQPCQHLDAGVFASALGLGIGHSQAPARGTSRWHFFWGNVFNEKITKINNNIANGRQTPPQQISIWIRRTHKRAQPASTDHAKRPNFISSCCQLSCHKSVGGLWQKCWSYANNFHAVHALGKGNTWANMMNAKQAPQKLFRIDPSQLWSDL